MDGRLNRIEDKLDKIFSRLDDLNVHVASQAVILDKLTESVIKHEQRSTNLEKDVEVRAKELELKLDKHLIENAQKLDPIVKHVDRVEWLFKVLKWSLGTYAVVITILKTTGVI